MTRDVLFPGHPPPSSFELRQYAKYGLLVRRGRKYAIAESRAQWKETAEEQWELKYCGDPSILWWCYKYLSREPGFSKLPLIKVAAKKGELPYLSLAVMSTGQRDRIEKYFSNKHHPVSMVDNLWEGGT